MVASRSSVVVRRAHGKHILQRHDADLIDRLDRPLGRRVVATHRLNRVADELEPDRLRLAGRKDVDDAAADRELAVLVRRILAREAGIDEQLREIDRRDLLARLQIERRAEKPARSADARHQGRGRRDHDAGGAGADAVQRPRAHRRHADVRRQPPVRIHLVRGERQNGPIGRGAGQPFHARPRRRRRPRPPARGRRRSAAHTAPRRAAGCWRRAATNSALAAGVRPDTTRAGTSMPLRAIAVFNSARRLREVEVVTGIQQTRNFQCSKLAAARIRGPSGRFELHTRRERPSMPRTIDADVARARLDAERVEEPMVIVRHAVAFVHGDVDLVGAFHEIQGLDVERHLGVAAEAFGLHVLRVGVGAVAAHAVGVEQADAEHEIGDRLMGADVQADRHRIPGVKHERRRQVAADKRDVRDLDVARSPAPLRRPEHVHQLAGGGATGRRRLIDGVGAWASSGR